MKGISVETLRRVAANARLVLTEDEEKKYSKDLSDILEAFRELDKVNTKGVKPSFQPLPLGNVLREDSAEKCPVWA